jgi:NADPH:quinone reductase-like Zn-dependent oxidoreductase
VVPHGTFPREAGTAASSALVAYQNTAPFTKPGDRISINGGLKGVGTIAVQIARAPGCRVTATCSADCIRLCKDPGADEVIDYKRENVIEVLKQRGKVSAHVVDIVGSLFPELYSKAKQIILLERK